MEKKVVTFNVLAAVVAAIATQSTIDAEAFGSHLGVLAESSSNSADDNHNIRLLADAVDTIHVQRLAARGRSQ